MLPEMVNLNVKGIVTKVVFSKVHSSKRLHVSAHQKKVHSINTVSYLVNLRPIKAHNIRLDAEF